MKYIQLLLCTVLISSSTLFANSTLKVSTDLTNRGPFEITSSEYRLPAEIDYHVLADRKTEIWARLYRPTDLSNGPYPLVVFLHGNHGTCGIGSHPRQDSNCEYTITGTCPSGYVVTPNHLGYSYLAENVASWGFLVISINANRGITCGEGVSGDYGLNLARGRLVLKHLNILSSWAHNGGAPQSLGLGSDGLVGKIDFAQVGLMGHSRGGEGVRAAYNLYQDSGSPWKERIPELQIRAIFEIGAVDGQTNRVLNANGIAWNQLLPMCDGDVSDLQGRYPFERMLLNSNEAEIAQKSTYQVWGANHNFFNTEWQTSDSEGCYQHKPIFNPDTFESKAQQLIALASLPAFFRSHLSSSAEEFNQIFNPISHLPASILNITHVTRDFTVSPSQKEQMRFEEFDQNTGMGTYGFPHLSQGLKIIHIRSDQTLQRVAKISWNLEGEDVFFQSVWSRVNNGRDLRDLKTLDFRITRLINPLNSSPSTDFSIQLLGVGDQLSEPVQLSRFLNLIGPAIQGSIVLQTVRIPIQEFRNIDLQQIRGIRFTFNRTPSGSIALGNIRFSRSLGAGGVGSSQLSLATSRETPREIRRKPIWETIWGTSRPNHLSFPNRAMKEFPQPRIQKIVAKEKKRIQSMKSIPMSSALHGRPSIEIHISSEVPFEVRDALPLLKIGNSEFKLSRFGDQGDLKNLIFTLENENFNELSQNSPVHMSYDSTPGTEIEESYDLGNLDKNILH